MKRTHTLALTAALICAGLVFGTTAFAQSWGGGEKGPRGPQAMEQGSGMEWGGGEFSPPRGQDGPPNRRGMRGQDSKGRGGPKGAGDALKELFPFWQADGIVEALVLTEDQITGLEQSFQTTKLALEIDKGSGKELHEALKAEMEKDSPDLETVLAAIDDISDEMTLKRKLLLSHKVAVKTILDEAQEENLREAIGDDMKANQKVLRKLRKQIAPILRDGGTIEDVEAIITEAGIEAPYDTMALEMTKRAMERRENSEEGHGRGKAKKGEGKGRNRKAAKAATEE
jgi:hypothetical protein